MTSKDRAVCVCFDEDRVLVMRRHKEGRDYCVLPGGGVEPGEDGPSAVVRELSEETGLAGQVVRHLTSIDHPDRTAHYYLLDVEPGTLIVGGPEAYVQSADNHYSPEWIPIDTIDDSPLVPEDVRAVVRDAYGEGAYGMRDGDPHE